MLNRLPGHLDRCYIEFVMDKDNVILYYGEEKKGFAGSSDQLITKGGVMQDADPEKLFKKVVSMLHLAKFDLIERARWNLLGTRETNPKQTGLQFKKRAL